MYIFAIESSCDDTSAAVLECYHDEVKLLSNVVSSQIPIHALYGGVVPEIASRAHCESITNIARSAVAEAGIRIEDIGAVAVTFAPGLIGSLLVGVNFAKSLASSLNVPLIPVDHIKAHVSAAYIMADTHKAPKPPFLSLVVSGGHTSLYHVKDYDEFEEIGYSMDDACGEAFDKVGRILGFPYPAGAAMDKAAAHGFERLKTEEYTVKLPSPAIHDDTLNFSFSGLKTAAINHIHNENARYKRESFPENEVELFSARFTESICDGISKKLTVALRETGLKTLVLAGGVAANSHLRRAIKSVCDQEKVEFITPSIKLCGDNAAMTGAAGYFMLQKGLIADSSLNAYASDEASEDYFAKLKNHSLT